MSNIPDYAMQVQEIERQIEAQCDVTAEDWKDAVQKRFYDNFISAYKEKLELYIHGGSGMSGKGINDLLIFLDEKMKEMEAHTGIPADFTFMAAAGASYTGTIRDSFGNNIDVEDTNEVRNRDGIVHSDNRERDYWQNQPTIVPPYNGSRPGEYTNEEIEKIMKLRQQSDFCKNMNSSLK